MIDRIIQAMMPKPHIGGSLIPDSFGYLIFGIAVLSCLGLAAALGAIILMLCNFL